MLFISRMSLTLSRPFIIGGQSAPIFPVTIACDSAACASDIFTSLHHFVMEHSSKRSQDLFDAIDASPDISAVCEALDSELRFYWVVVKGHRVGIYFTKYFLICLCSNI